MNTPTIKAHQPFKPSVNINLTYPYSDQFNYTTFLTKLDLDQTRINDIKSGKGFIIEPSRNIKNDVKYQRGIFSSRYGSTISDVDSFNGKYRCQCGLLRGSILHGERCSTCNTVVKFYDDDVSITGWLVLKEGYFIIHPNIYQEIAGFIGPSRLSRILEPEVSVNSDGQITQVGNAIKKDEPFRGIGMIEFRRRYHEILDFYLNKFPQKRMYYNDLLKYERITFARSIPVMSALLRPSQLDAGSLKYETTNEYFMMLSKLVYECNKDRLAIDRKIKEKYAILNDIQVQLNNVYEELIQVMAKKKGDIRSALGGRFSFSSRSVIRQDPNLKPDEIKLPYHGLLELLQQIIINILVKTLNIRYATAYKRWYRAQIATEPDPLIYGIIDGLIKDSGGIPVLINRNPTIQLGSIFRVRCVGINMNYTMSVSLTILKPMNADFDGDALAILLIMNKQFAELTDEVFNPIQFFISRNDGLCNSDMLPARDMLINANTLKSMGRYSQEEVDLIEKCLNVA